MLLLFGGFVSILALIGILDSPLIFQQQKYGFVTREQRPSELSPRYYLNDGQVKKYIPVDSKNPQQYRQIESLSILGSCVKIDYNGIRGRVGDIIDTSCN